MLKSLFAKFVLRGKIRIVLDTNILVSGTIAQHGPSAQILDWVQERRIVLIVSPAIQVEYLQVIRRPHIVKKYPRIEQRTESLVRFLWHGAVVTTPQTVERVVPDDPADDAILACAVAGRARYIVSGDHHLLELKQYRGVKIMTPRDFADEIQEVNDEQ
jgi:hypothetical protein